MESFIDQADRRRGDLEARHRPWRPQTLTALLDTLARRFPDRPFVIGEEEALSYADLADRSTALAAGWSPAGCRSGERVALVLPNGPDDDRCAVRGGAGRPRWRCRSASGCPPRNSPRSSGRSEVSALITMEEFGEINALDTLGPHRARLGTAQPGRRAQSGRGQFGGGRPG